MTVPARIRWASKGLRHASCSICATLAFLLALLVVLYLWPVFYRGLRSGYSPRYDAGYTGYGGYGGDGGYGGYGGGTPDRTWGQPTYRGLCPVSTSAAGSASPLLFPLRLLKRRHPSRLAVLFNITKPATLTAPQLQPPSRRNLWPIPHSKSPSKCAIWPTKNVRRRMPRMSSSQIS